MAEQKEIDEVNAVLFNTKLLKVKKILSVKNETVSTKEVHLTVGRIYFAAYSKGRTNFKRKQFQKIPFQGEHMLNALLNLYIKSSTKRDMLFREGE